MTSLPEQLGVENPAIACLVRLGYTHWVGKQVKVKLEQRHLAPVLEDVLRARLQVLNPWLDSSAVTTALLELRKRVNDELLPANKAFWEQVLHRSDIQVKDPDGKPRSVVFFDATDASLNDFHAVSQYEGVNGDGEVFRPDLLLFVNGLPLAIIECKATHHKLDEALTQLDGYQHHFAPHFVFNQVCVGINGHDARYGAILTKPGFYARYRLQPAELAQAASFLETPGAELSEQQQTLWALFEPTRFLELVTHMVLFEARDGKVVKKLPRYQQWRTVRKAVARLTGKATGTPTGGVVWHTQGSGKSLTMALLARILRADSTGLNNPSVLVLTDRRDLDDQIFRTFHAVGIKAIKAVSVDGLVKLLANDYGSVFTSTVHKFQEGEEAQQAPEAANAVQAEPEEEAEQASRHRRVREGNDFFMLEERNTQYGQRDASGLPLKPVWEEVAREKIQFRVLSNKANFYVLVDEAHRSQYDFLAALMRASLPNAKFVAFTGTPLLQDDKHTLAEFGGGEYIDEYRLHEAVADEATLPIKYRDAWVELARDAKLDEAFKDTFGTETPARQQLLMRELLASWRQAGGRMEQVARHLVEHFLANVRAKDMKAMLVCDGRDMAVRYQDLLTAIMAERAAAGLPTFETKVVVSLASMTASRTGASEVAQTKNAGVAVAKIQTIEERVRAELKAGTEPVALPSERIAGFVSDQFPLPYGDETPGQDGRVKANNTGLIIVSDMLLTGWDAPIVSTMYLDKPLKEHTLLQAIARVNRRMAGKTAGYIVDYHGVVEHLDHALKIYAGEVQAAQVWEGVESELPKAEALQSRILKLLPAKHDPLYAREAYKADAEMFLDPHERLDKVEDFLELLKQYNRALDIILPDVRAVPFKPYFTLFAEIRLTLRDKLPGTARERVTKLESALLQQMLDEHIAASPAKSLLEQEVSVFDIGDVARLKKLASEGSRALTMKNQLKHTIATGKDKDPGFFDKLGEEFDKLLAEEKAGRISQAKFLEQLELFAQQIADKDKTGFATAGQSAVFHYLSQQLDADAAQTVTTKLFEHSELVKTFASPHWKKMTDMHADIRETLRGELMPLAGWERAVARQHAAKLLEILLKN
jgi:type I restriction enzyme R subunit